MRVVLFIIFFLFRYKKRIAITNALNRDMARNKHKRLMTTADVAAHLSVSSSTVYKWIAGGKIVPAFVTPGGHARFDASEVDRILGRVNPSAVTVNGPEPDRLTTDSHLWREIKRKVDKAKRKS